MLIVQKNMTIERELWLSCEWQVKTNGSKKIPWIISTCNESGLWFEHIFPHSLNTHSRESCATYIHVRIWTFTVGPPCTVGLDFTVLVKRIVLRYYKNRCIRKWSYNHCLFLKFKFCVIECHRNHRKNRLFYIRSCAAIWNSFRNQ